MTRTARGHTIRRVKLWLAALCGSSIAVAAACGARSSLPVPDPVVAEGGAPPDAGPPDAPPDVPPDLPPPVNCEEAGITFIYVITSENTLYRFYPPTLEFTPIGDINCPVLSPGPMLPTPFSMAVDRAGKAYVLFSDGNLFKVSTATAACEATDYPSLGPSSLYGMGFSANKSDPGETLYVAIEGMSEQLASIDTTNLSLGVSIIGDVGTTIGNAELTGTGDTSRLFAFGVGDSMVNGSHLAELDKDTGAVLSDTIVAVGQGSVSGWAFAFWGGDFYFFTGSFNGTDSSSDVTKYSPADGSLQVVVTLSGQNIVGAGVSTCAPQ